jgi:hypothetical protein
VVAPPPHKAEQLRLHARRAMDDIRDEIHGAEADHLFRCRRSFTGGKRRGETANRSKRQPGLRGHLPNAL